MSIVWYWVFGNSCTKLASLVKGTEDSIWMRIQDVGPIMC